MIIRCPECSTGFNLPDERVTPDGTKLKCSRCEHVFRVREDAAGEVEIFYQPHDNKEPALAAAGGGDSPFPHAGLGLKPKASSAFGGGEDGGDGGDYDDEEASELQDVVEEPGAYEQEPQQEAPQAQGLAQESSEETSSSPLSGSGDHFGDPEDHVDPSFGEGGPVFDPEKGKVMPEAEDGGGPEKGNAPKRKRGSGPPPGAVGAPPTQRSAAVAAKKAAPSSEPSNPQPKPAPAPAPDVWDEDDLEPHKIGGSMGQKVLAMLLLLCLVGAGFIGIVASKNDGFIDFRAFGDMVSVAFSDGEYEPRPEWTTTLPEVTVVENTPPVAVEGVYGEVIELDEGEQILVVQGIVRNYEDSRLQNVDLRAMITTLEGRSLREIVAPVMGDAPSIGAFRELSSIEEIEELMGGGYATIEAGDAVSFVMVFEDVPQRVIDGDQFSYRVELVD